MTMEWTHSAHHCGMKCFERSNNMAFIVSLGVSNDPKNKIRKSIANAVDYPCVVKIEEGIDIMNPKITVQADVGIVSKNYAFIPDFNRYYFVTSISASPNGLWVVEMHEDVLMSFKDGILNSDVILNRSSDFRNYYLEDSELPVTNKTLNWTRIFPNTPFKGSVDGAIVTILGTND